MKNYRFKSLLIIITLLGVFLRLYRLGFESLWYDEVCSFDFARMPLMDILLGRNGMDTPPLYILLLRGWMKLGPDTDWWIRLLSAALGCISLWPAYLFGKRLFGKSPTLVIYYLLFALSGILIYFSQEARMYALLIFLVLAANILCLRLMDMRQKRFSAALAVATGAILYTHIVAALYVVSLNFVLILWVLRSREGAIQRAKIYFLYAALSILCALPAILFLNNQSRGISWLEIANRERSLASLVWAAFSRFVLEIGAPVNPHLLRFLAALLLALALTGIASPLLRRLTKRTCHQGLEDATGWVLVFVTALMPCLLLIVVSLFQSLFLYRYLLYSVPTLLACVATGIAWLPGSRLREIVVVVFALVFLGNNLLLAHTRRKDDCRHACEELLLNYKPNQMVAFLPGHEIRWFRYYSKGHDIHTFAFPGDMNPEFEKMPDRIAEFERKYSFLWVFYNQPGLTDARQKIPNYLDNSYRRTHIRKYGWNLYLVGYDLRARLNAR